MTMIWADDQYFLSEMRNEDYFTEPKDISRLFMIAFFSILCDKTQKYFQKYIYCNTFAI